MSAKDGAYDSRPGVRHRNDFDAVPALPCGCQPPLHLCEEAKRIKRRRTWKREKRDGKWVNIPVMAIDAAVALDAHLRGQR